MNKGISQELISQIAKQKQEPEWVLQFRQKAYRQFLTMQLPSWGPDLSDLNLGELNLYKNPTEQKARHWSDLPIEIKKTYDDLGLPEAEKKYLGGLTAQYESEVLYQSIQQKLKEQGVIFTNIETGYQKYPALFKKYLAKLIPPTDNFFAALNSAVFSGGVFLFVPKNTKVELPLQAYFRINRSQMGQFERTLIIAEEGSTLHYIEGCSAPLYDENSLHAGVVEVFIGKNARVRYTTIQNWSKNVYNLVTKRAIIAENGLMQWVDGNIGSKVTMKYPSSILAGDYSRAEIYSLALSSANQCQDTGGKMIHLGKNTKSRIISKSISKNGGKNNFFGLVKIGRLAEKAFSKNSCHSLILDQGSTAQAVPKVEVNNYSSSVSHEASVSQLDEEKLFYLQSRGVSPKRAEGLLVAGFVDDILKEIPFEFAIELNRLINLEFKDNL
jgi:Fe-S cluster assembly protein SufB